MRGKELTADEAMNLDWSEPVFGGDGEIPDHTRGTKQLLRYIRRSVERYRGKSMSDDFHYFYMDVQWFLAELEITAGLWDVPGGQFCRCPYCHGGGYVRINADGTEFPVSCPQ